RSKIALSRFLFNSFTIAYFLTNLITWIYLGKSQLGGLCDTNSDCEHKGSICLRGKCRCHPHYIEVVDDKGQNSRCKRLPAKIGESCVTKCREPLFCRGGQCQCVQRGTTSLVNGECVSISRVGDRCSRHYDCTAPFSACLNSQCVCITGTVQQGLRCVAAKNCPFGGVPGSTCIRKASQAMVENFIDHADDCPSGQVCVGIGESPIGHCCPVVCPLSTQIDTSYSCDLNATRRCPSDTHFCHRLSDGGFSQSVCCRRPCNAVAPKALYINGQCVARGQLNSQCLINEQCGGGESMQCARNQCECLPGFHPLVDSVTNPQKNPSQTCTRSCESNPLSRDTSCFKLTPLGGHCFIQKQCPKHSGCYRGRCMCKCGYRQDGTQCVELPPPPTTSPQPAVLVPGIGVPQGGDFLKLIGNFFGGSTARSVFGS
uniref:EB domain-containing protein n=1 Tax=Syphacia muris TaxID=451379 RepID=A0A0N5AG02_9BILA